MAPAVRSSAAAVTGPPAFGIGPPAAGPCPQVLGPPRPALRRVRSFGLGQHLDIGRQREEAVLEILIDRHRIRVHLEDLLAVAVAPHVEWPLHAAAYVP